MRLMQRFAQIIKLKPEAMSTYRKHHTQVWPEVLQILRQGNYRNYSIYLFENTLFGYFEYIGTDFAADQNWIAQQPRVQEWSALMATMQHPVATAKSGEWWVSMEEVFHLE